MKMSTKDENLLKSFLPEQFTYKFLEISYESELKHNTKFRVQEVRNEEDFQKWFEEYKSRSKTGWIISNTDFKKTKRACFEFGRDYQCMLSSRNKTQSSRRNLNCGSKLTVRIKKNTKFVRYRDKLCEEGFYCIIELTANHTHPIENAEALNLLRVSAETEELFVGYFQQGINFCMSL